MAPNAEAVGGERPVLALEGLYEQMAQDPSFHPDYSSLFSEAIKERRKGSRGSAVPYNGMGRAEESLSELYNRLLDEPSFHPDYSQLFTKALTERRDGKASPMLLPYGKQYKPDTPTIKVELYLPDEPKRENALVRLLSMRRKPSPAIAGTAPQRTRQSSKAAQQSGCMRAPNLRAKWGGKRGGAGPTE